MSTGETLQEEPQGTSEEPVPPEDMLPLSSVGSTMSQWAYARELTFSEKAVGLTFNPSGDERVNRAKAICAELIDMLGISPSMPPSSWATNVLRTAAFNAIIAAQMAVVKFITWKE